MIPAIVTTTVLLEQRRQAPLRDRIAARAIHPTDCPSCRAIAADAHRRPTTEEEQTR